MKKILFTLLIVAMLACPAMAQRYRQHQVTIVDEFGKAVTNIDQIEILDVGTSDTTTIYADRAGDLTMVNPITTSSTNSTFVQSLGQVRWFQRAPGYKITITESGASQSLTIDNQAEGDTRFPWYVNYIGTAASLTVGDDQFLNIGSSNDFRHDWDNGNTRYVIFSSGDGGRLDFGKAAVHTDVYFHAGDITTDYIFFDEGSLQMSFVDIDLLIDDEAKLLIGDSGDVTIEYDEGNNDLDILSTSALDEISFGATGDGYDLKWWSTTAGDYALFDYSADALLLEDLTLALGDGELLLFGDAIGTGTMSLSVATAKLSLLQVVADTGTFDIGASGTDVPTVWHGETAGAEVTFTGDTVIVDGIDMTFNDGDFLKFGDDFDWTFDSSTATRLDIIPLTTNETSAIYIGASEAGADLKIFGTDSTDYWEWDATADLVTIVGDAVAWTLTEAASTAVNIDITGAAGGFDLDTTNGNIVLTAGGGDNGDVTLVAADIMTFTSADIKIFDGAAAETWVIEGTANGFETNVVFTDPTGAVVVTIPDGGAGTLLVPTYLAYTASGNIDADECWGGVLANTGASIDIVLDLPTAVAGMRLSFTLTVASDVDLNPFAGDTILVLTDSAGDAISSAATAGNSITLHAVDANSWLAISIDGTWSDAN
ncbi:hypothetical protein LCGC14_0390470 [marine sediment metagenome]|uniref:Uncharacterized protein n=1 Tax=marine sediment metagenome TaxID=412755 RepID=A0A0F9THQ3_9ZZZZ